MNTEHNLFDDIKNSDLFQKKILDNKYAQNLYAALCQNDFQKIEVISILRDDRFSASWRTVGAMVAAMRNIGEDYVDYYCSGIRDRIDKSTAEVESSDQVPEGYITPEIMDDLKSIGWKPVDYKAEEFIDWTL